MRLRDGRVVPAFIGQALSGQPLSVFGDGSQTRSFCYVSDLIDGIFRLAMSDFHEPVNLGNPREMTIKRVCRGNHPDHGNEINNRIQTITGGRPEGAPTGHHPRERSPQLGTPS